MANPSSQKIQEVTKPAAIITKDTHIRDKKSGQVENMTESSGREIPGQARCRQTDERSPSMSGHLPAAHTPQEAPRSHDVSHQEIYILKVCRALMMYGAPTHRLEVYMQRTAEALELHLQSFYMPGLMIISVSDRLWRSKDVQIIRCTQSLNLSKLYDVHAVYKDVIHATISIEDATARLDDIMDSEEKFPIWFLIPVYGLACTFIGPVSYEARPVDLPIIFVFGSAIGCLELIFAPKSELYGYIFEISSAVLSSFVGRALGSIHLGNDRCFCFSAVAQASLVLILPGFTITNSALELQSRNIVSGAVRLVYGIVYTLFLAFGFIVGIAIYGAIDKNATSSTSCTPASPFWWQIIFVVPFTLCYIIVNQGKWRKIPPMLIVTLAGWLVNHFSSQRLSAVPSLAPALGAFTVGLLSNIYSRMGHGLAIALMHPAIYVLVPGNLAASGSLIGGVTIADELTHHATNGTIFGGSKLSNSTGATSYAPASSTILEAGYSMIEIGIGITVGLSASAFLVYPFRKERGKSGIFSF
jgi:uncharacterized membrane protein YjjP (DUF1212 family)